MPADRRPARRRRALTLAGVLTAAQTRQENARQGTAGGLTAAQIMALRPIEVHNHYPLPEKPSTATQRLANLPFLLGA